MTDLDLRNHTLRDLGAAVRSGTLRATELTEAALARVDELNPELNAWASIDPAGALAQAHEIDRRVAAGDEVGPLAGVPLGVKDLEPAMGFVTGYGSALHADDPVATEDSILVARLRAAGCVVVGKTTTPEHGWKADTISPRWGATHNPWAHGYSAGGSSGGSAVAVATGMVPLATGSDAGGSIRIPAAMCGISGLKATHGVVPLGGDAPPAAGLLAVRGPMARTAADIAFALAVAAGPHPTDCFSLPPRSFETELRQRLPERVVWAPAPGFPVDREVAAVCGQLVERMAASGTDVILVDSLFRTEPIGDWFNLWAAYRERAQGHMRGSAGWERIDDGLRDLMDYGAEHVDTRAVMAALDAIHAHNCDLTSHLDRASFVLTPTIAGRPAACGELGTVDGEPSVFSTPFTQVANMTRHPAGTVCAGFAPDGMPVGLQLIGAHGTDAELLRAMAALEELAGGVPRPPLGSG